MKRLFLILGCLLALTPLALAGDDAGTESVFNIGAGARAMGMGNGFTALADDATGVYYNPAGLTALSNQQISFLHVLLFEETVYDFISYVYPSEWGTFGIAGMRFGTDDIGRRDKDYYDLGRFSSSQMQILLSYGRRWNDRFSSGGSLKLAHHSIDTYSAYGVGLDLAGQIRLTGRLSGGLVFQDIIGARMQLVSEKERVPFTFKTGLAYRVGNDQRPVYGRLVFDLEKPQKRSFHVRTGVEAIHKSGLILRTGYDRDNFTLGMGIRYQDLQFDYAYKFIERLNDSHRFSLTFNFGASRDELMARREEADRRRTEQFYSDNRRQAYLAEVDRADAFYDGQQYDSALASYYRAEAYASGAEKEYVQSRIAEINLILGQRQAPIYVTDTTVTGPFIDLVRQARELYDRGALVAARDMAAMARRYDLASPELDTLELAITTAINEIIAANITKADEASERGDYVTAYDSYNTVLVYDANHLQARKGSRAAEKKLNLGQYLNLGLEYFNEGKYISAKGAFDKAREYDQGNGTVRTFLARIEERIKESTSLEDLQKDSSMWQIYLEGLEAFRRGDYEEAIRLWENVLEVYPNNRNTLENIEQARLRLKK